MLERPYPKARALGLDLESSGLEFHDDRLLLVQVSDGDDVILLQPGIDASLEDIGTWLREHVYDRTVICHNANFDLPFLDYHTHCGFPRIVWDTQTCEQLLTAGLEQEDTKKRSGDYQSRINLKTLAKQYLDVDLDKEVRESFIDNDAPLTREQLAYAGEDARVLVPIARRQYARIKAQDEDVVWQIEQEAAPVFAHMKRYGICVDADYVTRVVGDANHLDGTAYGRMLALQERLQAELTYAIHDLRIAKFDAQQGQLAAWLQALAEETAALEATWIVARDDDMGNAAWQDQSVDPKDGKPRGMKRYVRHYLKEWRASNPRPPKPKLVAKREPLERWLEALEEATRRLERAWWYSIKKGEPFYVWRNPPGDGVLETWLDEAIDKKDGKPKGLKRFVKHHLKAWRAANPRPPKPKLVDEPIDLQSPEQLKAGLATFLGADISDTKKATLQQLLVDFAADKPKHKLLADLLEYRECAKFVGTFGPKLVESLCPEGRLHHDITPIGTATGRPAGTSGKYSRNILQIPVRSELGKLMRHAFVPAPGHVFVICDYKAMELRLLAELSGDPEMIAIFQRGEDPHLATAKLMLGKEDVTKEERAVAKMTNFLTCFGGGSNKLVASCAQSAIYISQEEGKHFIDLWRKRFHVAWGFIQAQQELAVKRGWTASALGRRRHFVVKEGEWIGKVQRAGANHPMQSSNADVTKIAMAVIHRGLAPYRGRVCLPVYDEIVAEVPVEHAQIGKRIVEVGMVEAAKTVLQKVPVAVDCVLSSSWSEDDEIGG